MQREANDNAQLMDDPDNTGAIDTKKRAVSGRLASYRCGCR